jgi:hypothetical protein
MAERKGGSAEEADKRRDGPEFGRDATATRGHAPCVLPCRSSAVFGLEDISIRPACLRKLRKVTSTDMHPTAFLTVRTTAMCSPAEVRPPPRRG